MKKGKINLYHSTSCIFSRCAAIKHKFSPKAQKKYPKTCKDITSNFSAIEFAKEAATIVNFSPGICKEFGIIITQFIICKLCEKGNVMVRSSKSPGIFTPSLEHSPKKVGKRRRTGSGTLTSPYPRGSSSTANCLKRHTLPFLPVGRRAAQ